MTLLRDATRDAHHRIETVPALTRLLMDDFTREEYIITLQYLHSFHATLEPLLAAHLSEYPTAQTSLNEAHRPRLLAADLAWFDAPHVAAPLGLHIDNAAAALGALYVLEGSERGARIIARHLMPLLGISDAHGGSFFCRRSSGQWFQLVDTINNADVDDTILVAGACAMFTMYGDWMQMLPFTRLATNYAATQTRIT